MSFNGYKSAIVHETQRLQSGSMVSLRGNFVFVSVEKAYHIHVQLQSLHFQVKQFRNVERAKLSMQSTACVLLGALEYYFIYI